MAEDAAPHIPDHELLRRIGRGSYGDVWLARSITVSYRAVKVVYRSSFDHERPYDREFAGIKKFEPISRSSESQVDILHVGRDDAKGYFYYVMELADDQKTGSQINPADYTPRTLRNEIYRRGRLPLQECLDIGIQLTIALEHLHKNGLVHRDIKPSNIVFVNGLPKLADVGLVTTMDATKSFVGTEGYIPTDGPGTPQADLFSLGKVLYEISTGRDRLDFPELPTDIKDHPEREVFVQLNEVILKACEQEPAQRYQSANEMCLDLMAVKAGKPLARAMPSRNWKRFSSLILPACLLAMALIFGFLIFKSSRGHDHILDLKPVEKTIPQKSLEVAPAKVLEDPVIIGPRLYQRREFLISKGSTDENSQANLAVLDNGNILVTWHQGDYKIAVTTGGGEGKEESLTTLEQGKSYWHGCSQVFNDQGDRVGSGFLLNYSRLEAVQWGPSPAPLPGGGFVVAYGESAVSLADSAARVFDSKREPAGSDFNLGLPDWTAVASHTNGDFVAVATYAVGNKAHKDLPILARRFNSDGIPYGLAFAVGTLTNGYATASASYGSDGRFGFAWPSQTHCAMVRGYRSNEFSPFGAEFAANSISTSKHSVSARYNSQNELMVVWSGNAGSVKDALYGRRFDSRLVAEGSEMKFNENAPANRWSLSLSIGPNDESIVSWDSDTNIYARLLDRTGQPIGHEFRVNQFPIGNHTIGWEGCLHTAVLKNGNLVAGWMGSGASGKGVYLTVFRLMTNHINSQARK